MTPPRISRGLQLLAGFVLLTVAAIPVHAQSLGFRVVVNPANAVDSITVDELSRMFLKRIRKWEDGVRVAPVDLRATAPARKSFSTVVHRRGTPAVLSYWQQQIFAGVDMPPSQKSEAEAIDYVRKTPGAVAYVSPDADLQGVKVITIH